MKDIKLLISSVLIFISFFVWYIFWNEKNILEIEKYKDKKYYLNLDINNTKIKVNKDENIILKVNWLETNSWTINLN